MLRTGFFLLLLAVFGFGITAQAHHGSGTFELNKSVTFTGKLTKIELINPHSWLYFETTDATGKVMKHRCEMRSAHTLRRSGWSKELFPIGQQVTIDAAPDRADPASCYLNTIKFANGSRMDRYGQYVKAGGEIKEVRGQVNTPNVAKRQARRPTGEPNISGDWAQEQRVMSDPRGTGGRLVRLSEIGERPAETPAAAPRAGGPPAGRAGGGRGGRGLVELTDAGTAAEAKLTAADNPRFKCETTSILFDWDFDGAVNRITQNKDTIVIQYGQMNLKRTVYMNMKTHPANVKPTRGGHSIGRWEGDVLIVDTVGFLPGQLTAGTPHSDKLHVVERFTLDPKTLLLRREYTADDALFFKSNYTGNNTVGVADVEYTSDTCADKQFIDYSKQQTAK